MKRARPFHPITSHPNAAIAGAMRLVSTGEPPEALSAILQDAGMRAAQKPLAPGDLYRGPLAPVIMAPFLTPYPSRFSDGSFGVLYTAFDLPTAMTEHGYHLARFAKQTALPGNVFHRMHVAIEPSASLRDLCRDDPRLFDPNDYGIAQQRGANLHEERRPAIVYPSAPASPA